jgi:hypothetical protein
LQPIYRARSLEALIAMIARGHGNRLRTRIFARQHPLAQRHPDERTDILSLGPMQEGIGLAFKQIVANL